MTIDPRMAHRRRSVAEQRARKNIRRLVGWLVGMGLVAGVIWLFRSPLLSVDRVDVSGVVASNAATDLAESGVVVGVPLISVDVSEVEARLEQDPWVVQASVARRWPHAVEVEVTERIPVAWVRGRSGTGRLAIDGVVVSGGEPPEGAPLIESDLSTPVAAGTRWDDRKVLGALAFLDALRADLAVGAVVDVRGEEIVAEVAGFQVRLGFPNEMEAKGRVLAVVIESDPEAGSEITLLSPERPAVLEPSSVPAGEEPGEEPATSP